MAGVVNLHAIMDRSRANGPGIRMVIWFQGCTLGCPGCFNPGTHAHGVGLSVSVSSLVERVSQLDGQIDGVTISGGEPMQQPAALKDLLDGIRASTMLSVVLFSGYKLGVIRSMLHGRRVLEQVDVLVAGRYDASRYVGQGLLGSSNQRIHLLSARYRLNDIRRTPSAEIRIQPNGDVEVTGVHPPTDSFGTLCDGGA